MALKQIYWVKQNRKLGTWSVDFVTDIHDETVVGRVTIALFVRWSDLTTTGTILQRSIGLTEQDENFLIQLALEFAHTATRRGRRAIWESFNAKLRQVAECGNERTQKAIERTGIV